MFQKVSNSMKCQFKSWANQHDFEIQDNDEENCLLSKTSFHDSSADNEDFTDVKFDTCSVEVFAGATSMKFPVMLIPVLRLPYDHM